jgi:hypothetical protein
VLACCKTGPFHLAILLAILLANKHQAAAPALQVLQVLLLLC